MNKMLGGTEYDYQGLQTIVHLKYGFLSFKMLFKPFIPEYQFCEATISNTANFIEAFVAYDG